MLKRVFCKETTVDSKGKSHKQDVNLLQKADKITMTEDERCFVNTLIDSVTQKKTIKVKYLDDKEVIPNPNEDSPVKSVNKYLLDKSGGTTTIPTNYGAFAIMLKSSSNLEINSAHEILGHGVSFLHNTEYNQNLTNGVRMENVVRRILNMEEYDGLDHDGDIKEPTALPVY